MKHKDAACLLLQRTEAEWKEEKGSENQGSRGIILVGSIVHGTNI